METERVYKPNLAADAWDVFLLDRIYGMPSPYDQLRHINPSIEQIHTINQQLIVERRQIVETEVEQRLERLQAVLKQAPKPVSPTPGENKAAEPAPKRTITISQSDIFNTVLPKGYMETENDIDRYLNVLRERLTKAVSAGDRVRIK